MILKLSFFITFFMAGTVFATENLVEVKTVSEVVYVEAPMDTDHDGELDRIYVSIDRPAIDTKLSTIFYISPYALGGTEVEMHNVDVDLLPQDEKFLKNASSDLKRFFKGFKKTFQGLNRVSLPEAKKYARINAHSLGTGRSTGCPSVGDMSEAIAGKAVIDWLNGRARAFYKDGTEARADWANGNVGMTGTSYDGTLPIMVATTGVEGLKAIIPVASISSWYDYYRANGLVVNPGGYVGEDADILGYFIVRKRACQDVIKNITQTMGREHGDFTKFWQDRDYVSRAKNIKAATFIIHGQSDWNVKQKHAIQLWDALEGVAPRRMFLHRGGHSSTRNHDVPKKVQAWFDHFLEGEENGITEGPQVEVELPDGSLIVQNEWPHENTETERFYFSSEKTLTSTIVSDETLTFTDLGQSQDLPSMIENDHQDHKGRLLFVSEPLNTNKLLSGTARVSLSLAVMNRKAANITVAIVEFDKRGRGKIITRGWADPQNYRDITQGEVLIPEETYSLSFNLEPKQYQFKAESRIGILVASTDRDYTIRPKEGTEIQVQLGQKSFIELRLTPEK